MPRNLGRRVAPILQPAAADAMLDPTVILLLLVAMVAVAVVLSLSVMQRLPATRWARWFSLGGIAFLPLLATGTTLRAGIQESSRTRFCLSCHEMQDHGKSLFADDRKTLPAVHYQNRLVDRDKSCYSCHTDYALFGDVKAKMNGLRHVWVHYVGTVPKKFALYQPYANRNCLHCHEDARRFVEAAPHKPVATQLRSGALSCLSCHNAGHNLAAVAEGRLWLGQ